MMAPPIVPPIWLRLRFGRLMAFLLLNQSLEARKLLRLNQYPDPCNSFVPDGETSTMVLAPPPMVGLALVVVTVNSATCAIVNRLLSKSRSFVRTLSCTLMPSYTTLE